MAAPPPPISRILPIQTYVLQLLPFRDRVSFLLANNVNLSKIEDIGLLNALFGQIDLPFDGPLGPFAKHLNRVTALTVRGETEANVEAALRMGMPKLVQLTLINCQIGTVSQELLAGMTKLTKLCINNCRLDSYSAAGILPSLVGLQELNLGDDDTLQATDILPPGDAARGAMAQQAMDMLGVLDLGPGLPADPKQQRAAVKEAQREISMGMNRIGLWGARALAPLTELKKLNLAHNRIGGYGLGVLQENLKKLEELDLSYNELCDQDAAVLTSMPGHINLQGNWMTGQ